MKLCLDVLAATLRLVLSTFVCERKFSHDQRIFLRENCKKAKKSRAEKGIEGHMKKIRQIWAKTTKRDLKLSTISIRLCPWALQFIVRKKMAAVRLHFITIPCELNTAHRHISSHFFSKLFPVLTTSCILGLKFLELLCAFYERFKGFVR